MEILTQADVEQIITEINDSSEITRRTKAKRRHDIYKDDGKKFLLEQIKREFSEEAISEMRLAPLNLLKKIVQKRSQVYKVPPVRVSQTPTDQTLVDYYVEELDINMAMIKANQYFTLHSNTALYCVPFEGELKLSVNPPQLYSIKPKQNDKTEVDVWTFSAFNQSGSVTPNMDVPAATGVEGWSREPGDLTEGDMIASNEKRTETLGNQYIIWSDAQHITANEKGKIISEPMEDGSYPNPIGKAPVVNLAKDRDNEPWANQFEDAVDLSLAIMMGWTDLLTIAKHQGFSILTIVSKEEPKQLKIGVNKAVWLRKKDDGDNPTISYVQANSPLAEYKDLLMDLLALLLSTNNMPPNSIGGINSRQSYTSGFHALIEMADVVEAVEMDKPYLKSAELELWEIIALWHNWMYDMGMLEPEAQALGKFSNEFELDIIYRDIKPIESIQEKIATIKDLNSLGLINRLDSLQMLYPDMNVDMIKQKLVEIDNEARGVYQSLTGPKIPDPLLENEDGKDMESEDQSMGDSRDQAAERFGS